MMDVDPNVVWKVIKSSRICWVDFSWCSHGQHNGNQKHEVRWITEKESIKFKIDLLECLHSNRSLSVTNKVKWKIIYLKIASFLNFFFKNCCTVGVCWAVFFFKILSITVLMLNKMWTIDVKLRTIFKDPLAFMGSFSIATGIWPTQM